MRKVSSGILKLVVGVALVGVSALGGGSQALATSYTFSLSCAFGGSGICTTGGPYGTVTVADFAVNQVKVTVDTTPLGATSKDFFLALNTSGVTVTSVSVISPDVLDSWSFASNAINADGYCPPGGCFDVGVSIKASKSTTPVAMLFGGTGLTAASFLDREGKYNKLFAAAHVGNITPGGGSLWVGATRDPRTPPVSEPTTLLLLGTGLVGLVYVSRRNQKITTVASL